MLGLAGGSKYLLGPPRDAPAAPPSPSPLAPQGPVLPVQFISPFPGFPARTCREVGSKAADGPVVPSTLAATGLGTGQGGSVPPGWKEQPVFPTQGISGDKFPQLEALPTPRHRAGGCHRRGAVAWGSGMDVTGQDCPGLSPRAACPGEGGGMGLGSKGWGWAGEGAGVGTGSRVGVGQDWDGDETGTGTKTGVVTGMGMG